MALIHCDFFSEVLGLSMSMNAILPQDTRHQVGMVGRTLPGKKPCLYLLHGLSDDHTTWIRRTAIERYVAGRGIAVVMPAAHKSRYADLTSGERYWEYISDEVPRLARLFFNLSDKREDNLVAGLSMGGHGAFKLALNFPERYAAAASLSGTLVTHWEHLTPKRSQYFERCYGSERLFKKSVSDLPWQLKKLAQTPGPRPRLYQACGSDDPARPNNREFRELSKQLGIDLTYEEGPGGHEWSYWDTQIQKAIDWMMSAPNT